MIENEVLIKGSNIAIMGLTFKENTNDTRNSKVFDIIRILNNQNNSIQVVDPYIDEHEILLENQMELRKFQELEFIDGFIFSVAHNEFKNYLLENIDKKYRDEGKKN